MSTTCVTGRIHLPEFRKYWETIIQPAPLILQWLRTGIPLYPHGTLTLATLPDPLEYRFSITEKDWTRQELKRLLQTHAIQYMGSGPQRPPGLLHTSPIFLRDKTGPKKHRLLIDLRRLNACLPHKAFRFEELKGLLWSVGRNWWTITLDLRDGYHHIMMSDEAQPLLGFRFENHWYKYRVLPFGLSQAVWIFCKVVRSLIGRWRSLGITCGNHVDDFYVAHLNRAALLYIRDSIIAPDLRQTGWVRAEDKGYWEPTQQPTFYGFIIDTVAAQISIPPTNCKKFGQH